MDNNTLPLDCKEPVTTPILLVYRFRVHKVKKLHFMEKVKYITYFNFSVYSDVHEYFEVRVFLNEEGYIENVKAYHNAFHDAELIGYVIKAITQWISRKCRASIKVKYKP